jgi:hypothetical protein
MMPEKSKLIQILLSLSIVLIFGIPSSLLFAQTTATDSSTSGSGTSELFSNAGAAANIQLLQN